MSNWFSYERISTKEERGLQKYDRQDTALNKYAKKHGIRFLGPFKDDASGKNFDRDDWKALEAALHEGDTIVMKDLSRFTRDSKEGYKKYIYLMNDKKVNLVFIDNPNVDTDYIKKLLDIGNSQNDFGKDVTEFIVSLMLKVELQRVEQERLTLIQRTKDGIAASGKTQGRKKGQVDKLTPALKKALIEYNKNRSIKQIDLMKKYRISRNTLKKYAKIVAEETKNE